MSKPVTPADAKWQPGKRGRPPKFAKAAAAAAEKKQLPPPPTAPDPTPAATPPPLAPLKDVDVDAGGFDPLAAPTKAAPDAAGAEPGASAQATAAPTVQLTVAPEEPWNDPHIVAGLEQPVGMGLAWVIRTICERAGKIPPRRDDLDKAGFSNLGTKAALVVYPDLAKADPRWLIVGEFATMCMAIVKDAKPAQTIQATVVEERREVAAPAPVPVPKADPV